MDIRDKAISAVFEKERPDIVNHHAAQMDVRRSVSDPVFDAEVNILGMLNLLQNSAKYGVKKLYLLRQAELFMGSRRSFPLLNPTQQIL